MNNILKKMAFLIGFSSFTIPYVSNAYSIADAIRASRANNLDIKASRDDLQSTKSLKYKAFAGVMPNINAESNFTNTDYKSQAYKNRVQNPNRSELSLNVVQPLFSGGSTLFDLNYAKNSINSAQANLLNTKEKIILSTINAYEDLLTKRELYNLSIKKEEAISNHLKATQAKLELGEATITDVSLATSRLAAAISDKEQAKGAVIAAEANFTAITGDPVPANMEPIKLEKMSIPANLEQFMEAAIQKNSNIQKTKSDAYAAKNQKQKAFSALSPKVNAFAQFNRNDDLKIARSDGDTYGVQVKVPIFQGGAEYADIRSSKYQERRAQHLHEATITGVTQKVIQAWSEYYTTKAVIESSAKAVVAAQNALFGTEEEAKVGTKTTLDILDAENELFAAKIKNAEAHKNNVIALFSIHALMSTLNQMDFNNY
ncbi:type I secretion outer membrane protein [endosymbiont of Acanthamoeba sp. UWC8]|uniref:TolC family outer membrane protein n=1 Tax=endosymbiont of Acanthamoeba sp. UWC8 TaxID=86106 RepID=UPI0004D15DB9|nr:TolC family outer membrane protein [endosymbiont of Acanthamoeba sp. UWC8]AIF81301.1 type I secretion outer membrane protein [endosymbiont of Acanthamoeba sp. UWC8]